MYCHSAIFVSIASYRDKELVPTLRDLIHQAAHPDSLHIVVCWQDDIDPILFEMAGFIPCTGPLPVSENQLRFHYRAASITFLPSHYFAAKGTGWARHRCETLYAGEDYFLQIDAHMRFISGWDQEMIRLLQQLSRRSPLPVLTAYPPAYQPAENETLTKGTTVSRIIFRTFSEEGLPAFGSQAFTAAEPVRGSYLAGGFIFSYGRFVTDVPNDPQIFFCGEEIAMAVRAFTRGYDIYHPHKILLWHYYQREHAPKIWQDHSDEACQRGDVALSWWQRDQLSKQRVSILLGLNTLAPASLGVYGPGTRRSLRQFEYQCGVDFQRRLALPAATGDCPQSFFAEPPESDASWIASFNRRYRQQITVTAEHIRPAEQDYQFFLLAVFDLKNQLLFKTELPPSRLPLLSGNPPVVLNLDFTTLSPHPPCFVRLSGWQPSAGWGPVTEIHW